MTELTQNQSAIVIGASIAGLVTARVLSDHFTKVYLIERDSLSALPQSRKGQPQANHAHILLARGLELLQRYFPGLSAELNAEGATVGDPGHAMIWHTYGGYRAPFSLGKQVLFASRPFLEWKVRERVLPLKNLEVLSGYSAERLVPDLLQQQVMGVRVTSPSGETFTWKADLIVDASGRGSRSGKWLEQIGYAAPQEVKVRCGTGYTTRVYRRQPKTSGLPSWIASTPHAPVERRGGAAFPVEGDRWIVSLFGWHGDHAPCQEEAFRAFARNLPTPELYSLVSRCEPLSDFFTHKFPYSLRRHYEKFDSFPQGYLVLGDAVCSFNPIYGQGMTSALLQAATLDELLQERQGDLWNIAEPYFQRIAKLIDIPWQTAVGEDFRYPQATGPRRWGTGLINAYLSWVHRATHTDPLVSKTLAEVLNLLAPPARLLTPRMVGRVLRNLMRPARLRPSAHRSTLPTLEPISHSSLVKA
ncbi:FAD-dependent oxidoreductase [Catalinimonas alkaloidigena]|nr:FAD-binding monooxygenase [Catalinimonas alkaloidigena]